MSTSSSMRTPRFSSRSEERRVGEETVHTRLVSDWSSDVCSSDLPNHVDLGGCFPQRTVFPSLVLLRAGQRGFRHDLFDFIRIAREAFAQQLVAGFGDEHIVFDAHAEILFKIGRASCR